MTDRLDELREALERARENLNRADRAWADARDAYDAEMIANAPFPVGTVLVNDRGERLKISRWIVSFGSLKPLFVRPKKDGTFGTREHREWTDAWKKWKVESP